MKASSFQKGLGRPRILVVDDEAAVCAALRRVLQADYDVVTVCSAQAALGLLRAGARFQAILSDVTMPEMTGPALLAILANENPAHAAVLTFITGGAVSGDVGNALACSRAPVFPKPFVIEELREHLRRVVTAGTTAESRKVERPTRKR